MKKAVKRRKKCFYKRKEGRKAEKKLKKLNELKELKELKEGRKKVIENKSSKDCTQSAVPDVLLGVIR